MNNRSNNGPVGHNGNQPAGLSKVDSQDIVGTARQLRDEENEQLHVTPWPTSRRRFKVPAWLVAVPAAAIVGFMLGVWTNGSSHDDTPLTAMADTVYIYNNVREPADGSDTTVVTPQQPSPTPRTRSARRSHQPTGRPMADDQIRYDLLVKN